MRFVSTRRQAPAVPFSRAMVTGLAPDGGLYVPESFPSYDLTRFDGEASLSETMARFLRPFLEGDLLQDQLDAICRSAFDFAMPQPALDERTALLELFHGPTAAFKDFGARFLAECFERLLSRQDPVLDGAASLTILVATSGDTGGAVASAFHRRPGVEVGILFPRGGVSPRQERQLTCWDGNVRSFAVRGTFDDCQRLAKQAFRDGDWPRGRLTSANSINIGRLLPQAAFYAASSMRYRRERGADPGYVVPSGNLGDAVGAFWARQVGFPIGRIALACNANRTVPQWFETGEWQPRQSVATLANAMDVGDPSNMERLFDLYPDAAALRRDAVTLSVDDATIREVLADGPGRWGRVWCPHTATAVHFLEQLPEGHWVVVATAHPAKFDSTVEPLIGRTIEVPPALAELLSRPTRVTEIDPDLDELKRCFQFR